MCTWVLGGWTLHCLYSCARRLDLALSALACKEAGPCIIYICVPGLHAASFMGCMQSPSWIACSLLHGLHAVSCHGLHAVSCHGLHAVSFMGCMQSPSIARSTPLASATIMLQLQQP